MIRSPAALLTALGGLALLAATASAQVRVQLELVTEPGFPLGGERQWSEALRQLPGTTLRIRKGQRGDRPEVQNIGTDRAPSYKVSGILTRQNTLRLPQRTFSINDARQIAGWLEDLRAGGTSGVTEPRQAFGLTAGELVDLHKLLQAPVTASTRGREAGQVVRDITAPLAISLRIDAAARQALAGRETVRDELSGLTSGTALAAAVRPLGLVLTIEKTRSLRPGLLITSSERAAESWPVGWPSDASPRESIPALFQFINVEVDGVALEEALDAVQQRLDVPFLYDHNSLARQGIDPARVTVKLPGSKTYYKRIIDRLLSQARLKAEVRVDEAGKAFLWITSLRG